jgi:hypothetical protein
VSKPSYDINPDDAFRAALTQMLGTPAPTWVRYDPQDEKLYERLMTWIGGVIERSNLPWSTITGLIEAAESLIASAIENANISDG